MLGTKCPSITSRWIQSAPAASTARTSSPSFEKSDARIDGAITRGRGTKEADIGAVFRKLFRMREKRFFGLTCESPAGNAGLVERKNLPSSGTNCRSEALFRNR